MNVAARQEWWARPPRGPQTPAATAEGGAGRTSRLPFIALLAFTVVLILAPQDHFTFLRPLHLAFVPAALAGGAYVYDRLFGGARVAPGIREYLLTALLVAWAVVTVPFSIWPGGSVGVITGIFLKAVIIFWLLGRIVVTTARLKTVAWTLSLIAVPLSVSAVHSFLAGGFADPDLSQGLDRIAGYQSALTANPNDLALMINLILPLTVALLFCTRSGALRILLGAVAFLDVIAVMATYSRGGFLMLATMFVAYLAALWRRGRRAAVAVAAASMLLAVPLLPSGYVDRLATITNIQSDETGSAQARWSDMRDAAQYAIEHPVIGAGIGMNFLALNDVRGDTWKKVHDIYLEYAMDLGFPGLLLFVLILREVLRSCRRARAEALAQGRTELSHLAEGLGVGLTGFVVAAVFYPDAYEFYFFYFAGLAVAVKTIADAGAARIEGRPEGVVR